MRLARAAAVGVPLLIGGGVAAAYANYRSHVAQAERAMASISASATGELPRFDPDSIAGEPEIARRYFRHAIAPGTPLATTVTLEMRGTFLLGDTGKHQRYVMRARQRLRPPFEFVWIPVLTSGPMSIAGSDGLVGGQAWTRFFLWRTIPVANVGTSADMVRSAQFRAATEGLWLPASLLPRSGVRWEQIGPHRARLTITRVEPHIGLELTLSPDGAVREVVGERWSNANPDQRFRLQPFGGTVHGEATFGGFTIPSRLHVGNHYGTADYFPFFQAEIVRATYR